MGTCCWVKKVEAFFDGEAQQPVEVEQHLAECPDCAAYYEQLAMLRDGAASLRCERPIEDAQFPAFMAGIRDEIETPARGHRGFWAVASMTTAALILSLSVFYLFTGSPESVRATEVETVSTELEGATVHWYNSDDGVTTVQIEMTEESVGRLNGTEDDLW